MAHDERVKERSGDLSKRCPVCEDIKEAKSLTRGSRFSSLVRVSRSFAPSVVTWRFAFSGGLVQ